MRRRMVVGVMFEPSLLLLIEDGRTDARIARASIEAIGTINVDSVGSRQAALEWFANRSADYVVADLRLPDTKEISDRDWIEEVCLKSRGARVYVLSSEFRPESMQGLSVNCFLKTDLASLVVDLQRIEKGLRGDATMREEAQLERAVERALERTANAAIRTAINDYFKPAFQSARMLENGEPDWRPLLEAAIAHAWWASFWASAGRQVVNVVIGIVIVALMGLLVLGVKTHMTGAVGKVGHLIEALSKRYV